MDFQGPLPESDGFDMITVVVCKLTKRVRLYASRADDTAAVTAQRFINNVVCLFGVPNKIISDRGPAFASQLWREIWTTLGADLNISTARHPETDGSTENMNRTVATWLRHFVDMQEHGRWAEMLGVCEYSLNSTPSPELGMCPFECDLGRRPRAPLDLVPPPEASVASAEFLVRLDAALHQAQDAIARSQEQQVANADSHRRDVEYNVGDRVLLSAQGVQDQNKAVRESTKLTELYHGPYTIKKKLSAVVYELDLPKDMKCHPVFHVSRLRRYLEGPQATPRQGESVQQPTADTSLHEVESVVKERTRRGKKEVLVKWKGWGHEHNSWVPKANYNKASRDLDRVLHPTAETTQRKSAAIPAVDPTPQPHVVTTTRSGRVVRSYAQVAQNR